MIVEIELSNEQIKCFIDFYCSTSCEKLPSKNTHEVLALINEAFSGAIESENVEDPTSETLRSFSGRAKLLWQVYEQDNLAINSAANSPQEHPQTRSLSLWNWVASKRKK
jgi:hypothetical protein